MKDIEHFTHQQIEVSVIEGFAPEPGEKAEPIAMGRQTIWGGLGRAPSRDVMAAAAKAARSEMMERIREKKVSNPGRARPNQNASGPRSSRPGRPNADVNSERSFNESSDAPGSSRPPRNHAPRDDRQAFSRGPGSGPSGNGQRGRGPRPEGRGDKADANGFRPRPQGGQRPPRAPSADGSAQAPRAHSVHDEDYQPRENAHLGTHNGVNAFGHKNTNKTSRTPDPTRTSVDLMSERRSNGGANRSRGPKPAGSFAGKRTGGGGNRGGGFSR